MVLKVTVEIHHHGHRDRKHHIMVTNAKGDCGSDDHDDHEDTDCDDQ